MFSQVYWHHAVRAQKAMLFRSVAALLGKMDSDPEIEAFKSEFTAMVVALPEVLYESQPPGLFPDVAGGRRPEFGGVSDGTDLSPTDAAVLLWFRARLRELKRPEAMLIDGILGRNLFKRAWVLSYEMEPARCEEIMELWDKLDRHRRFQIALDFERAVARRLVEKGPSSITSMDARTVQETITDRVAGEVPWLLVDVPGRRPGAEVGLYYVLESQRRQLRKDTRAVGDLRPSEVWNRYAKDLRKAAGKVRVYCDSELADALGEGLSVEDGMDILKDVLEQAVL